MGFLASVIGYQCMAALDEERGGRRLLHVLRLWRAAVVSFHHSNEEDAMSFTQRRDHQQRHLSSAGSPYRPIRFRLRSVVFLGLLVALLVLMFLFPAAALAEEPFRMGSQIEDRVGAIAGREDQVREALDELASSEQVQLWVTYVDTFSGLGAQDWADETAIRSDLGLSDVLLAVAVKDRAYSYSVDRDFPLDSGELATVMNVAVEPALIENDWAGAAIGAAGGMGQALRGETVTGPDVQPGEPVTGGGSGFPWGLVIGVIILVVVILVIWNVARRARRAGPKAGAAGADAGAPQLSLEELRRRVSTELVETDDAVKTSTDEVGFAAAQFGEEQAAPFQRALEEAKRELDEAFRLHRQLEDAQDEAQQRQLLTAILQHTDAANRELDVQSERFDRLRDLEKQAPKVLDSLGEKLSGLEARVPQVRDELARLAGVYSPAALAAVSKNPDEAAQRLVFAREQVSAGMEDVAAGRTGEAAVTSLAAEEATAQAEALLEAVGRLGKDLQEARGRIGDAIAETQRDIAEASAAGDQPELMPLVARAEAAVAAAAAAASPAGGEDPLASLRHLEQADEALEQALVQVREETAQRARAAQNLDRTLVAARAQIAAAGDYITTHRGAVGSGPRTLLAEAQRNLDQAVTSGASDPVSASRFAANAHELAGRALRDAQTEVEQTMGGGMGGMGGMGGGGMSGMGGSLAGAIIGGILAGGLMGGGGSSGGFGGSFGGGRRGGGGGFAPPSFGGMGTRMRRGGGGRF